MNSLTAYPSADEQLGYFRIFAKPPGGQRREITLFRGAPVVLTNATLNDPFTHQTAELSTNQITVFDNPGSGDLDWVVPDCDIDVIWQNTGDAEYEWTWEGYIASYDFSLDGTSSSFKLDLKGAFYGLDDYMAIPSFPKRPIPYEILISQAFDQRAHPSRLGQFRVLWPAFWNRRVPEVGNSTYLSFLKPWGVATGQRWTGFTSRSTGSWEPVLTGQVQSLLSVMFAEGGAQWSIRNRGQRRPELYLRQVPSQDTPGIIEVTLGAPGVSFSGSRDFTQRATVIYGQGVDEAGVSYSGLSVSPDGKTSIFKPFAWQPNVYPRTRNPNLDPSVKPKETMIRFQDGVDQISAMKIAQGQLQRFAEPGITGTLTLTTDARFADGRLCPRMLIQAASTIRIKGFFGGELLVHATNVSLDFVNLTCTITFDSKYRDQLTVAEVEARTRDALTPLRALQVGKYANTVNDLVLPWSYAEGSGCVPLASREFFNEKLPSTATFPYEEWTKKFPPKDPASRPYYIRINPPNYSNASKNWSGVARDGQTLLSIPIRMAQAGAIRLTQICAYDRDGNVLPVRFHFSMWGIDGANPRDTPEFPYDPEAGGGAGRPPIPYLKPSGAVTNYGAGQNHPMYKGAWESVNENGTAHSEGSSGDDPYLPAPSAGLKIGWGNYYEPAGYSPGRLSRGAAKTGMLEDNTVWQFDTTTDTNLDLQNPSNNAISEYAGMMFVQIYCDDQGDQPVFFLGRFFRQEPGTT